ncbi:hypothetical protein KF707_01890 [Candidatus Obscuribacterales bacterium]|nr:hypothetical protein [Candidatus Obscuribacterales bacterium]
MKIVPREYENYQPQESANEHGESRSPRILQDMADPALSDKGKFQKLHLEVLETGDVVKSRGGDQALALTSGETIQRSSDGSFRLFDRAGLELGVINKQLPQRDIYPPLLQLEYPGGVTVTDGGVRSIISYPDGTEVHIDSRDGFASVRRCGRTYSIGGRVDDFNGFK